MKIVILGGGPAGLYAGLLIKKANPQHDVSIIERNPADVTYGWGWSSQTARWRLSSAPITGLMSRSPRASSSGTP